MDMTTDAIEEKLKPSKILVVDDNSQNLELLVEYLQTIDDVETSTAADGIDALEMVQQVEPDLILMDISGQIVVSVSKRGREGHVSKAEAESRCLCTIASLIDRDLKTKLQKYFDGLVKL